MRTRVGDSELSILEDRLVRPLTDPMYPSIRVLNVFLASPSDVEPEREAAHRVAAEINASVGRELNWRVELLVWEDVGPDYVRPQEKINTEAVDVCDLFVGVLWERWGQATGHEDYDSGFREEFERAVKRHAQESTPDIWLYLKDINRSSLLHQTDQIRKVIEFRDQLTTERKFFPKAFRTTEEWEVEFRKSLYRHVIKVARQHPNGRSFPTQSPEPVEQHQEASESTTAVANIDANTRYAIEALTAVSAAIRKGRSTLTETRNWTHKR